MWRRDDHAKSRSRAGVGRCDRCMQVEAMVLLGQTSAEVGRCRRWDVVARSASLAPRTRLVAPSPPPPPPSTEYSVLRASSQVLPGCTSCTSLYLVVPPLYTAICTEDQRYLQVQAIVAATTLEYKHIPIALILPPHVHLVCIYSAPLCTPSINQHASPAPSCIPLHSLSNPHSQSMAAILESPSPYRVLE